MDINTVNFIAFFLLCMGLFYSLGNKYKKAFLLAASYVFYAQAVPGYLTVLIMSGIVTYVMALVIEKLPERRSTAALVFGAGFLVMEIFLFKYLVFLLNLADHYLHIKSNTTVDIIQPLGISFFTLQAVSYLTDVWRKDMRAERNIVNVLLYVSFFPCILSGPIQKGKELMPKLRELRQPDSKQIEYGIKSGLVISLKDDEETK